MNSKLDFQILKLSNHNHPREEEDQQSEWVVNVYPKGVWFQRCLTVYRPPGLEVLKHKIKELEGGTSKW